MRGVYLFAFVLFAFVLILAPIASLGASGVASTAGVRSYEWTITCKGTVIGQASWNWTQNGTPIPGAGGSTTRCTPGVGPAGIRPSAANGITARVIACALRVHCSENLANQSFDPSASYNLTVSASINAGDWGNAVVTFGLTEVCIEPSRPAAPSGLRAFPGSEISLGWALPPSDCGSPITSYNVYRGIGPGTETYLASAAGDATSYSDSRVANGATYYYQVTAVNAFGESRRSNEASASTPPVAPSAPENLQATPGNAQVALTWQLPLSNGGSPITNYEIYRGTNPGTETFLVITGNVNSYIDAGLTNDVGYYYQVSAINAAGQGPRSTEAYAIPKGPPAAPLALQATPNLARVDLTWQPPFSDGGSPITNYRIYRGTVSGGETLLTQVGNVLAYSDPGVSRGTTYFYRVSAVNAFGEGPRSIEAFATAGAPTAPQGFQATSGIGNIGLAWLSPAFPGGAPVVGYRIYRGTSPGAVAIIAIVGNILKYLDTNVSAGSTYFYQISAFNTLGEGARAAGVSATPQSPVGPPFPWTPALAAGIVLTSAAVLGVLLHTRILREDVLQRRVRMLLFEYTRANPGSSFSKIRDAVGLKNGVAAYHLRVLEKQGLLHSKSHRRHRWFYPNGDVSLWKDIPLSSLQSTLISHVRRSPGLGIRDLARAVDRRPSSVAYNVRALVREKVLRTERVGAKLHCFMGNAASP